MKEKKELQMARERPEKLVGVKRVHHPGSRKKSKQKYSKLPRKESEKKVLEKERK